MLHGKGFSLEIWSDDPMIVHDLTDTLVLRIGTGTLLKLRPNGSSTDSSQSSGLGSSSKKRP